MTHDALELLLLLLQLLRSNQHCNVSCYDILRYKADDEYKPADAFACSISAKYSNAFQ